MTLNWLQYHYHDKVKANYFIT